MTDPLIKDAYLRAVYSLTHRGRRVEFSFDPRSIPGANRIALELPQPWAIISARDPMSRTLDEPTNLRREEELDALLRRGPLPSGPAEGRSADGSWREPSRIVFASSRQGALSLARRFEQRAVVWAEHGCVGILDCPTERWSIRPIFGAADIRLPARAG